MATRKNPPKAAVAANPVEVGMRLGERFAKRSGVAKRADPVPKKTVSANRSIAAKKANADRKTTGKGYAAAVESKPVKIAKKAAAKKPEVLKHKGYTIPVNRKSGESEESIPTIAVKTVSDTVKLFEKLPKGCTWLTDVSSSERRTLCVYNKNGAMIAEVRIDAK